MESKSKKLQQFPEGTFFSVPLEDGRFAVGIISRRSPKRGKYLGHFGYYWGPYLNLDACKQDLGRLNATNAQFRLNCGGLNLHSGRWTVLGRKEPWDRVDWPFPDFYQYSPVEGTYFRVRFDEDNINKAVLYEPIPDSQGLDEDMIAGADIAEFYISRAMGASSDQEIN